MKVANLVRACFPYVFSHGLITQEEIDEFLKPGSGSVFGMGNKFPVLKVDDGSGDLSFTTDTKKEYSAFYKPDSCSLSLGGKKYLLSCQFRNKGVDDVMSWLKRKGMTVDVIQEELAKHSEDNLEVEAMEDKLTVALNLFQDGRATKECPEGWNTFDEWAKNAEQVAGLVIDENLAENPETYAEFIRNFSLTPRNERVFFVQHTLEERRAVLKYLREQQLHPKSVEWYLDKKNLPTSTFGVRCKGFGPAVMLYAMMRLHPTKFVAQSEMTYSSLDLVGLHGEPPKKLTVETYEDCKAKCDKVLARMHEMGIGKTADDDSDADYITVNEFLWFVNMYQKEIAQALGVDVQMKDKMETTGSQVAPCVTFAKNTSLQQITYGAPGTGKSYGVKKEVAGESVIRTTFHPDSDYATFVGAYKPTMEFAPRTFMKGEEITKVAKGDANLLEEKRIVYKFVPQAFLQAYEKAWKFKVDAAQNGGTAKRQYLVIEEINRGNCAQIFGDLFQLLDRNDAGFSDYEIVADEDLRRHLAEKFADAAKANEATPLDLGIDPALAKRVLTGEALLLPDNLFIRATMNTSDQSLFPIDSAFKRRWDWKYVPIAKPKDTDANWKERVIVANGQTFDWWRFLEIVNAQILEVTKSEDKQLGYFFVKAPDATGEISASQFTGKVLFYLYNDVFRDETPPENLFGDGSDGNTQYRFKMFFDEQGEPKEDVVAAFLAQLFKKNPEKGKPAEASAGDTSKGTDEA